MNLWKKSIVSLLSFQLVAFPTLGEVPIPDGLDMEALEERLSVTEEDFSRRGIRFVGEQGQRIGLISFFAQAATRQVFRAIYASDSGKQVGFLVQKIAEDLADKKITTHIAVYDESFRVLYSARTLVLDLSAGATKVRGDIWQAARILEEEIHFKGLVSSPTSPLKNPLQFLLNQLIPTAHADEAISDIIYVISALVGLLAIGPMLYPLGFLSPNIGDDLIRGTLGVLRNRSSRVKLGGAYKSNGPGFVRASKGGTPPITKGMVFRAILINEMIGFLLLGSSFGLMLLGNCWEFWRNGPDSIHSPNATNTPNVLRGIGLEEGCF